MEFVFITLFVSVERNLFMGIILIFPMKKIKVQSSTTLYQHEFCIKNKFELLVLWCFQNIACSWSSVMYKEIIRIHMLLSH